MTETKAHILDCAVQLATRAGYLNVTRAAVAEKANVAAGTVSYQWKSVSRLHDGIMKFAVEHRLLVIVAQGLASGHRFAKSAPDDLRFAAAALLAG